jgi:hypothetical protein
MNYPKSGDHVGENMIVNLFIFKLFTCISEKKDGDFQNNFL